MNDDLIIAILANMFFLTEKDKPIFFSGLVGFGILLVFSVFFLWERVLFLDFSFYMFEMVRNADFYHPGSRFIAFVNQAPALLAVKAHLPLYWVLQLHSVSFPIFHLVIFLLLLFVFKQRELALVLLLFNILIASDTFYWCESEFPQGVGLSILFVAVISHKTNSLSKQIVFSFIAFFIAVTAFWAHPLVVLPFGFVFLYFFIQNKSSFLQFLFWGALLLAVLWVRFFVVKTVAYEENKLENGMNGIALLSDFFSIPIVIKSLPWFIKYYWVFSILGIVTAVVLVVKKQWIKLFVCITYVLVYYVLVCISFPVSEKFYVENLWLPISIGVALPFAFEVLPLLRNNTLITLVLLLVVILRGFSIFNAHHHFTDRKNWWDKVISAAEKQGGQKFVFPANKAPLDILHYTFSTAAESMLYSTVKLNGKTICISIEQDIKAKEPYLNLDDAIITESNTIKYTELNKNYFNFKNEPTQILQ